jgi:hypothetical protein
MTRQGWLLIPTLLAVWVLLFIMTWYTGRRLPAFMLGLGQWGRNAWTSFKRQGYLLIPTIIAAYAGMYAIMEASHERQANRALFERSIFMTMVTASNRATFVAAMKTFGPVQTRIVPGDPHFFDPRTWIRTSEMPNREPLRLWAASFFPFCKVETCGKPQEQEKPWRIDLSDANLSEADLSYQADRSEIKRPDLIIPCKRLYGAGELIDDWDERPGIDLHEANLRRADLFESDLTEADLRGACLAEARLEGFPSGVNLQRAKLQGADLHGACLARTQFAHATFDEMTNLRGADLSGAELSDAIGLTQAQLDTACIDNFANLPWRLTQPPLCQGQPWRDITEELGPCYPRSAK